MRALHCLTTVCLLFLECSWVLCIEDELRCLKTGINEYSVKKNKLELIKQEILLRLNLTKPPENPTLETIRLFKENSSVVDSYNAADSAQSLRDEGTKPCVELERKRSSISAYFPAQVETYPAPGTNEALFNTLQLCFQVNLSDKVDHELTKAELRLYKIVVDQNSTVEERIDIILVTDTTNYFDLSMHDFTTGGRVKADRNGYIIFDVLPTIKKWKDNKPKLTGELKLKVNIRTANKQGFSLPPTIQFASDNSTTQLVITTSLSQSLDPGNDWDEEETDAPEEKRHASQPLECSLRPLSVNLHTDLNFTWVLFPAVLELNYCSGLCGGVNAGTKHAKYLKRRETISGNPIGSSRPCCVPNGYATKTLSLVPIRGANGSAIETLEDITITSCVCR